MSAPFEDLNTRPLTQPPAAAQEALVLVLAFPQSSTSAMATGVPAAEAAQEHRIEQTASQLQLSAERSRTG